MENLDPLKLAEEIEREVTTCAWCHNPHNSHSIRGTKAHWLKVVEALRASVPEEHASDPKPHALPPGLERLYKAAWPFVKLMHGTSGRIPTERLSFSDWHELSRAYGECSPPMNNSPTKGE